MRQGVSFLQKSDKKRQSSCGSVTSFMCIALAVIILFNVVLVDCARMLVLRETVKRKTFLCAESLAADYLADLQDDYGLYGLYFQDSASRRNSAYDFLSVDESLLSEALLSTVYSGSTAVDFFDYDIEKLKLTHLGKITDPQIMKDNICSLMKYKVPADLLLDITDKIDMFGKGSALCEIQALYAKVSDLKNTTIPIMEEIKLVVEGTTYTDINSVKGWDDLGKKMMDAQINMINELLPVLDTKKDSSEKIKEFFQIIKNNVQVYKDYNSKAVSLIYDVKKICEDMDSQIQVIESELTELDFTVDVNREYYKNITSKIEGMREFIKRAAYSSSLQKLKDNVSIFTDAEDACNSVINGDGSADLIKKHISTIEKVKNIKSDITLPVVNSADIDSSLADYDMSDSKDKYVQAVFSSAPDIIIPDKKLKGLPSVENNAGDGNDISAVFDFFNNLDIENMDVSSFDGISEIGESFLNVIDDAAENIYLNEYIESFFYSEGESGPSDRFFTAEIEYIISGEVSQKANVDNVYKQILAIRTAMNFIHILLDVTKVDFANKIGNAIAVATFGIGGPIYAFIIMGIWATAEAAIDVENLKKGESVPFYKDRGDWKLDIGAGNIGSAFLNLLTDSQSEAVVTDKDSPMNMRYKDYLNILLLGVPQDTKLMRICDLIELNLGITMTDDFDLSDVYTGISCDLTISVKPFIDINFLRKKSGGAEYEMRFIGNSIY